MQFIHASAMTLTLLLGGSLASAQSGSQNQPHPQPGATWTVVLGGQVGQYTAKETDSDGDSVGTTTIGGRSIKSYVIHMNDQLRLQISETSGAWLCDVPATALQASTRDLTGQGTLSLRNQKTSSPVGDCRIYTRALPTRATVPWSAVTSNLEWELDTPEGVLAVRWPKLDQLGTWGKAPVGSLTASNASGQVLAFTDKSGLVVALMRGTNRADYRFCTVEQDGQSGPGFLTGRYVDTSTKGDPKELGTCALRPASSPLPVSVSGIPTWPLPISPNQVWEMGTPQGTFVGMVGTRKTSDGDFTGGWLGSQLGLLQINRFDVGTRDEGVLFLHQTDQDDLLACRVNQTVEFAAGIQRDQFAGPGILLDQKVKGDAISLKSGGKAEKIGECWVRRLVTPLVSEGLRF
ncbi:hypothetical protein [Deinococcus sp. JMULE3]|uniref:hypothetical protein n=1 Tax=Deinococcus sp. JMULE3 TaxID=2518341 RepID=UPI0015750C3F|nr:hypothetical protein [Deinococcus sp. JMULE3]NTY00761.1 hypothetical protein [Deinococcus sp. JMULE3]